MPLGPDVEVVPSEVWIFLVAGGSALLLWCFFDLKRKDILGVKRGGNHVRWLRSNAVWRPLSRPQDSEGRLCNPDGCPRASSRRPSTSNWTAQHQSRLTDVVCAQSSRRQKRLLKRKGQEEVGFAIWCACVQEMWKSREHRWSPRTKQTRQRILVRPIEEAQRTMLSLKNNATTSDTFLTHFPAGRKLYLEGS